MRFRQQLEPEITDCMLCSDGSTTEAMLCDALQGLDQICAISHSSQRAGPLQLAAQALIRCAISSESCSSDLGVSVACVIRDSSAEAKTCSVVPGLRRCAHL